MVIEDSSNVLIQAKRNNGDWNGSIGVPDGGEQSANLVVTGTTEGVVLKDIYIPSGAGMIFLFQRFRTPPDREGRTRENMDKLDLLSCFFSFQTVAPEWSQFGTVS